MPSVFISYSRKDYDIAKKISNILKSLGNQVFMDDQWEIAAGAPFRSLIDRECKVATCVLVLWSKSAVESNWVNAEAQIGLERGRLLQITLDNTEPPMVFNQYNYGTLNNWDGSADHSNFIRILKGIDFFVERDLKK